MKTRTGKIAQLPKAIRDELNQRLENGRQGLELLNWLNSLPETKDLLAAKFDNQPITKSNLSDWRHGGYLDWRMDQAREQRIRRIAESGETLEEREGADLFENFARIAVAELATELDSLSKLRGEKRSRLLHNLIRDLARLQNSYNRSRWADLAWTKWNYSLPPEPGTGQPVDNNTSPCPPNSVVPDGGQSCGGDQHDSPADNSKSGVKQPEVLIQTVHYTNCDCLGPCPKCHAPDSKYPLDEVLRDQQFIKEHDRDPRDRHGNFRHLFNYQCDCACDRCAEKPAEPIGSHCSGGLRPQPNSHALQSSHF